MDERFVAAMAALVALLSINRLVIRSIAAGRLYWALAAANVGAMAAVLLAGLPGLDVPVARYVVAGLLALHLVENAVIRSAALRR
jgi:hypothetical protein